MRIKDLFSSRRGPVQPAAQTAAGRDLANPYRGWMGYTPLIPPDAALFDAMREAIPIIDAALDKIVRLTGTCAMQCSDPRLQDELDFFLKTVRVGPASHGIHQFIGAYLYSLLTYGSAVGEIVPNAEGSSIHALYNARLSDVLVRQGEGALDIEICTVRGGMQPVPVQYPELVLFSALAPAAGSLRGTPILRGLPFISDILTKIFSSIGTNFERIGNLRYAVTYRPESPLDRAKATDIASGIAKEWSQAMSGDGPVRDFVAVGDVDIKVIGSDNQMLQSDVPVRQMLEQIVAKLGIPPFMLGLSWSSTERMSSQQADILTSELESYRRLLDPALIRICDLFLRLRGSSATVLPVWNDINLQDEAMAANIRLIDARVRDIEANLPQKEEAR